MHIIVGLNILCNNHPLHYLTDNTIMIWTNWPHYLSDHSYIKLHLRQWLPSTCRAQNQRRKADWLGVQEMWQFNALQQILEYHVQKTNVFFIASSTLCSWNTTDSRTQFFSLISVPPYGRPCNMMPSATWMRQNYPNEKYTTECRLN